MDLVYRGYSCGYYVPNFIGVCKMKTIRPVIDGYCVDCPAYNGEYMVCNITRTKCPSVNEDGDVFTTPLDCPAREGFTVKI